MSGDAAVLVTGGAGYIGSFVVQACLADGLPVVVLDDHSSGHAEAVRRAGPVLQAVTGGAGDGALVRSLVREYRIGACVHLAGSIVVPESVADPLKYFRNNAAEGFALLQALVAEGVKRFVFSSSAAVYGLPQHVPVTEDEPLAPINPYGESKLMIEQALHRCEQAYGLRYAALRYFNAAGADPEAGLGEAHDPETHLIPLAIDAALELRPGLTVYGDDYPTADGTPIRDYVDVRDLAAAHVAALRVLAAGTSVGPLNVGTGNGHSVREVLEEVAAATGRTVPHEVGARRAGDPPVLVADAGRAAENLQWVPQHTLGDSIRAATAWRRAGPQGYPVN